MCEKIQKFWNSLDVNVKVNKRELLLGVTACTLMGVVVGMLVSPRTNWNLSPQLAIGSNNASNNTDNGNNNSGAIPDDQEPEAIEE